MNNDASPIAQRLGHSIWIDSLDRDLIDSGLLQQVTDDLGVSGVSCARLRSLTEVGRRSSAGNPSRFGAAGTDTEPRRPQPAIRDVQDAADVLRPLYHSCSGDDGFVSIEICTDFARNARQTLEEARRLWMAIGRPNVLIGIPGTRANLPVVRDLVSAGINVNVTLLYDAEQYRLAFEAYMAGLMERIEKRYPIWHVGLVASFPVGALDKKIDELLLELSTGQPERSGPPTALIGMGGPACLEIIEHRARTYASSHQFSALAKHGARLPRLLWSLGNAGERAYPPAKYADPLVHSGAVLSMPVSALRTYCEYADIARRRDRARDRGQFENAMNVFIALRRAGIDMAGIAERMQAEALLARERAAHGPSDRPREAGVHSAVHGVDAAEAAALSAALARSAPARGLTLQPEALR